MNTRKTSCDTSFPYSPTTPMKTKDILSSICKNGIYISLTCSINQGLTHTAMPISLVFTFFLVSMTLVPTVASKGTPKKNGYRGWHCLMLPSLPPYPTRSPSNPFVHWYLVIECYWYPPHISKPYDPKPIYGYVVSWLSDQGSCWMKPSLWQPEVHCLVDGDSVRLVTHLFGLHEKLQLFNFPIIMTFPCQFSPLSPPFCCPIYGGFLK